MYGNLRVLALAFMAALWAASCGDGGGTKDTTQPQTTATPAGGNYDAVQDVTLTCDDGTGSGCTAT
jgi:hypothetical protein